VGTFSVTLGVADRFREQYTTVEASVDTGSTYTSLPASLLDSLGIGREEIRRFELGDNRVVEYSVGETRLRLEGREFTAVVIFAPDDASPLVGMTTLEMFGLGVDPVEEKLVPVIALRK
jgi:predicted aspartyl protease